MGSIADDHNKIVNNLPENEIFFVDGFPTVELEDENGNTLHCKVLAYPAIISEPKIESRSIFDRVYYYAPSISYYGGKYEIVNWSHKAEEFLDNINKSTIIVKSCVVNDFGYMVTDRTRSTKLMQTVRSNWEYDNGVKFELHPQYIVYNQDVKRDEETLKITAEEEKEVIDKDFNDLDMLI